MIGVPVAKSPGIHLHTGSTRGGGGQAGMVSCPAGAQDRQAPDESLQGKCCDIHVYTLPKLPTAHQWLPGMMSHCRGCLPLRDEWTLSGTTPLSD